MHYFKNSTRSIYILCLVCIFFLIIPLQAEGNSMYRFRRFSPEGGFYYNGISSIRQDREGFIWFIMDNDLYRFDGYEYKNYHSNFGTGPNTPGKTRQFHSLQCDQEGVLLAGTHHGLYRYDRTCDIFRKLTDKNTSGLYLDRQNNLWLNQNNQTSRYSLNKGELKELGYRGNTGFLATSYADNEKTLFLSSMHDIYRFDYETSQITPFFSFGAEKSIQSLSLLYNKLWVLVADDGLYSIDITTMSIENRYNFFHQENEGTVLTRTIHIDRNGYIWIGTQQGLYILDPTTGKHVRHTYSDNDPFCIPNNSIWSIEEDREGNIWIGTYAGGLCYVNPDENLWIRNLTPRQNAISHYQVSGFAEDENFLWIATEGGGINRMDKKSEEIHWLMHQKDRNSLSSNNTKSLVYDKQGRLWIATFRGGLNCYDTRTDHFTHFKHDPADANSLLTNDLRKILPEGGSGIWINYQSDQLPVLSFYSFEKNRFAHFPLNDTNDLIYDMCRDDEHIWLLSEQLYKFDISTQSIEIFHPESGYLNGQTLCVDNHGDIWIGTVGQGLLRFDIQTKQFFPHKRILEKNVYSILSLCMDEDNNLWLGTDNGLLRYDPVTDNSLKFDRKDGAQGHLYYPNSCYRSKNGEIYFGGTNGFNILKPRFLRQNLYQPEVILCEFYLDNIPSSFSVNKKRGADHTSIPDEIVLDYTQTNFGFTFSSDNYLSPEKNRFRYRLKDYDNQWKETGAENRSVYYTRVPPGNYIFEIMAANNDGIWNYSPRTIRIKRLPAPWLSWPAYLLYSLVLLSVMAFILYHYNRQKKLKMQLYLEALDKEKKEEIYQSQLRFFTNISHDFRTPLFLMVAVLDKLREGGWKENYYPLLHNNVDRLLRLVNELMDFRTIENGKMRLQVQPTDINQIIRSIADDFYAYAQQNQVRFEIKCDAKFTKPFYTDKKIFEKILLNLLNNAFKYTPPKGSITIETYVDDKQFYSSYEDSFTVGERNPGEGFLVVVRDTGIGISKNSIRQVFERFYKVEDQTTASHLGSGIGLALVKSLVLLHKGSITLYSKKGTGTDIVICLPVDLAIYQPHEWLIQESEDSVKPEILPQPGSGSKFSSFPGELLQEKNTRKKILLVEDNEDLRHLIADSLGTDFDVTEAAHGEIATKILDKKRMDLIISDIMMPVKDGITLCHEVKKNRDLSHIPFIMLTAKTTLESKLEGTDAGADIYFEKPVDSRLLKATISNLFQSRKMLQEHYAQNYYADSDEISSNEQDQEFLKRFIEIVDKNLDKSRLDINFIASELCISRAKLYNKVKTLTNRSTVEFILNYRLRKAARLLLQENLTVRQIMEQVGIESPSYFSSTFKKEFGETPTAFIKKNRI